LSWPAQAGHPDEKCSAVRFFARILVVTWTARRFRLGGPLARAMTVKG
jgi:hypothetical protein